jgi:transcriptional regulator with XRE-family HTH domain
LAKKTIYSDKQRKLCALLIQGRKNAGLTQQAIAEKLKRPQSFVAKYEGGERRLDVIELQEIAKVLKLDMVDLLKVI